MEDGSNTIQNMDIQMDNTVQVAKPALRSILVLASAAAFIVIGFFAVIFTTTQEKTNFISFVLGTEVAYADTATNTDGGNNGEGGGGGDGCGDGGDGCCG